MSRKKVSDSQRLTRKIGLRVSGPFYDEMKTLLSKSNCQSVAELARHVLYKKRIITYTKDATVDATAAELAAIKKELRAIGVNINQVTRYFNSKAIPSAKILEALKILDEYKKVSKRCDQVLASIDKVAATLSKSKTNS
jgi:hypothetical protein